MHYILFYDVTDDYLTRRVPLRSVHLAHARAAHARGELVLAGALVADLPPSSPALLPPAGEGSIERPAKDSGAGFNVGAVLVFKSDSPDVARIFAENDPYVINGLVKSWRVREWTTVVGDDASVIVP